MKPRSSALALIVLSSAAPVLEAGEIRGVVRTHRPQGFTTDKAGKKIKDPRLMVRQGKLANAIIRLEGVEAPRAAPAAAKVTLEDQRFAPHVVVVRAGGVVEVVNHSDQPMAVRLSSHKNPSAFEGVEPGGTLEFEFPRAFDIAELKEACCWTWASMRVVVARHGYVTTTDADGAFSLKGIPPGTYRLRVYHDLIKRGAFVASATLSKAPAGQQQAKPAELGAQAKRGFTVTIPKGADLDVAIAEKKP